jgi:cytochrome P450
MSTQTKIPKFPSEKLVMHDGANSGSPITFRGYTAESLIAAMREVGPIFETKINGAPEICFAGLDANDVAWRTPDDWSYGEAVSVFRDELSELHLTQLDKDAHRRKRRLLNKGFRQSSIMEGMPSTARTIQEGLESMADEAVELHVELMKIFTKAQSLSAVKMDLSDSEVARMVDFEEGFIGALFETKDDRATIYNRAGYLEIKSGVLGQLHEEVKARFDGVTKDDLLDMVIHQKTAAAIEGLTEEELIYDAYLLLIAGTGNTSKLLCYLLNELAQDPEWTARLTEELKDFDAHKLAGGMKAFPLLKATLMETERLFPAAPVLPRVPAKDIEFLGYPLSEGEHCLHLVALMHYCDSVYEEPLSFKPQRWIDHEYPKNAHGVFGGGSHVCLGMNVARIQMPLTIGYLLSRYNFEILSSPDVVNYAYPEEKDSKTLRMNFKLSKK